jgi:hypothetical protein
MPGGLNVTAQDHADADAAAAEIATALTLGAYETLAGDVVAVAPVFAGLSGPDFATAQNVMKAIVLVALRRRAYVSAFVDQEVPAGAVDGVNATFTLANTPSGLHAFVNGLLQLEGVHFTRVANVLTFTAGNIPQSGDQIRASYRH